MIQFLFVDVVSDGENKRGICPSTIIIFDKSNPRDTMSKAEEQTFTCPEFDRTKLFDKESPAILSNGNNGNMIMTVTKKEGKIYQIRILEKGK